MKAPSALNGVVVVDKPAGMTSHDVVDRARKLFRTKRIGHTGTLDPDATGVLVLCLGVATRLAEYLSASRKHYVAEVVFGIETDTQDASGQVLAERDASALTAEAVRALLPQFEGTISQVPPMVSALHHQGKRLYELAREGITVERAARTVQIDRIALRQFVPGRHPVATLEVTCSTGTYIRTLAADIGAAAGYGGMMQSLRRTWVGSGAGEGDRAFTLEAAHTLEELEARAREGTLAEVVLPLRAALVSWPQVRLEAGELARLQHGQSVRWSDIPPAPWQKREALTPETPVAVLDLAGEVCAIARAEAGQLRPVKVLTQL